MLRGMSDAYQRLSPPARVGVYMAGSLLATALWSAVLWVACRPPADVWVHPERYPAVAAAYLAGTYVLWVGGALWAWRRQDGRVADWFGRGVAWLPLGLGLGLTSLASLVVIELAAGWVLWGDLAWEHTPGSALVAAALTALFFGATEELLFRGFVHGTLRKGWGEVPATIASSGFYALMHFLRLDLGWVQVVTPFLGLWLAGALLAWTVERSRSLWLATGLHAGWVYVFFVTDRQHLLGYPSQFEWLTGGGFPLGGVLSLAMLLALWGLLLMGYGLTRGAAPAPR